MDQLHKIVFLIASIVSWIILTISTYMFIKKRQTASNDELTELNKSITPLALLFTLSIILTVTTAILYYT